MLLIKDATTSENIENTVDLARDPDWFRCHLDKLNIDQLELGKELGREVGWSEFAILVEEKPNAKAFPAGIYIVDLKSSNQQGIVPIYGIAEYKWLTNQVGYAVGTTYPVLAQPGTVSFISLGNEIFSIGCPVSNIDEKIKLPESLERRLEKISSLQENWNSYSANRIGSRAINKARLLLVEAALHCGKELLESAFVAPCSDGGIQLEFKSESEKELIVKLKSDGKTDSLLLLDNSGEEIEKQDIILRTERWNAELDALCSKTGSVR